MLLSFQPGCVNTTEIDIKKACQMNKPATGIIRNLNPAPCDPRNSPSTSAMVRKATSENLRKQISLLKTRLDRSNIKVSKVAEA